MFATFVRMRKDKLTTSDFVALVIYAAKREGVHLS
jgi:hypothetical protein